MNIPHRQKNYPVQFGDITRHSVDRDGIQYTLSPRQSSQPRHRQRNRRRVARQSMYHRWYHRLEREQLESRHMLADFGDAPFPYPTLEVDDGARHDIVTGFSLGSEVDEELDGHPSLGASGDDNALFPNDEDGVSNVGGGRLVTTGGLKRGNEAATLEVFVNNTAGLPHPTWTLGSTSIRTETGAMIASILSLSRSLPDKMTCSSRYPITPPWGTHLLDFDCTPRASPLAPRARQLPAK